MKRLIIYSVVILCGITSVSAQTYVQTVITVKSEGCPTKIGVPKVTFESLYHDVSEEENGFFGSGEPNWGEYEEIARFNGKPVKMGYDYHSLNHCVLIGDEVAVNDIALLYDSHDPKSNTVTFRRGLKKEKIDFTKKDAVKKLKALCATPDGWTRDDFVYCYTGKSYPERLRREIAADIPSDAGLRKIVLEVLEERIIPRDNWRDTLYVIDKNIDTFIDIVEKNAEYDYMSYSPLLIPALPASLYSPDRGINDAISWDYVWESPEYLTLVMTHNATYSAGGGRGSEDIYYTIDKKSGHVFTERDLVNSEDKDEFVDVVKKAIFEDMVSPGGEHYYTMDEIDEAYSEYYDPGNEFNVAFTGDTLIVGYPGERLTQFGEDGNWNVVLPLSILKKMTHRQ